MSRIRIAAAVVLFAGVVTAPVDASPAERQARLWETSTGPSMSWPDRLPTIFEHDRRTFALWSEGGGPGGDQDISRSYYSVRGRATGVWSAPQLLSGFADPVDPRTATDGTGTTTVAWSDWHDGTGRVLVMTIPAGSRTFGKPQVVAEADRSLADVAVVAATNGDVTVGWHDRQDEGPSRLRTRTWTPSSQSWGPVQDVADDTDDTDLELAITGSDRVVTTWTSAGTYYLSTRDPVTGAWSEPHEYGPLEGSSNGPEQPRLAAGPDGGAVVVWPEAYYLPGSIRFPHFDLNALVIPDDGGAPLLVRLVSAGAPTPPLLFLQLVPDARGHYLVGLGAPDWVTQRLGVSVLDFDPDERRAASQGVAAGVDSFRLVTNETGAALLVTQSQGQVHARIRRTAASSWTRAVRLTDDAAYSTLQRIRPSAFLGSGRVADVAWLEGPWAFQSGWARARL